MKSGDICPVCKQSQLYVRWSRKVAGYQVRYLRCRCEYRHDKPEIVPRAEIRIRVAVSTAPAPTQNETTGV